MEKKRKKKTKNAEFWDKYQEQFERTDRHIEELLAKYEARRVRDNPAGSENSA